MTTDAQRAEYLEKYREFLRNKTAKWAADTETYIYNCETLLYDAIQDIYNKGGKILEYGRDKDKGALCTLVKGELPVADKLKFDAMIALAFTCGVSLTYEVITDEYGGLVEFKVSEFRPVWIPQRILKSTKVASLDVIEDVNPATDEELSKLTTKVRFNQTFFNLPTMKDK